jgi:hypothetical protein
VIEWFFRVPFKNRSALNIIILPCLNIIKRHSNDLRMWSSLLIQNDQCNIPFLPCSGQDADLNRYASPQVILFLYIILSSTGILRRSTDDAIEPDIICTFLYSYKRQRPIMLHNVGVKT